MAPRCLVLFEEYVTGSLIAIFQILCKTNCFSVHPVFSTTKLLIYSELIGNKFNVTVLYSAKSFNK